MQRLAQDIVTPCGALIDPPATREAERSALAADSLRAGGRLRLQVRGESMLPTLWPGDLVEIASSSVDKVHPGEIVLALRDGRFSLHRFVARSQPDSFLLRGDSMPGPDPQFPNEALLGQLVRCAGKNRDENGGQYEANPALPLRPWARAIGQLLCHCGPVRRLALTLHARRMRHIQDPERAANAGKVNLGVVEDSPAL